MPATLPNIITADGPSTRAGDHWHSDFGSLADLSALADVGQWRISAGVLGIQTLGVERLRLSATELLIAGALRQAGGTQTYLSTTTLFQNSAANARITGLYSQSLQTTGGGTGVTPLVGIWGTSNATGGAFASPSHAVGVVGYNTLGAGSLQGAGYYGVEGRVDHIRDVSSSPIPSSWGVLGLVSMMANAPANLMASIGAEGRIEIASGVTGAANHILIGGKFTVTTAAGGTVGSPSAINLLVGDGTILGQNFPLSLRGYSSLTANTGEAKADFKVLDLGAGGALLFFDLTDARMALGHFVKLSDTGGVAKFLVQNSGGATQFSVGTSGIVVMPAIPAFVAADKYLTIDASGNVHKSAVGPAS